MLERAARNEALVCVWAQTGQQTQKSPCVCMRAAASVRALVCVGAYVCAQARVCVSTTRALAQAMEIAVNEESLYLSLNLCLCACVCLCLVLCCFRCPKTVRVSLVARLCSNAAENQGQRAASCRVGPRTYPRDRNRCSADTACLCVRVCVCVK